MSGQMSSHIVEIFTPASESEKLLLLNAIICSFFILAGNLNYITVYTLLVMSCGGQRAQQRPRYFAVSATTCGVLCFSVARQSS